MAAGHPGQREQTRPRGGRVVEIPGPPRQPRIRRERLGAQLRPVAARRKRHAGLARVDAAGQAEAAPRVVEPPRELIEPPEADGFARRPHGRRPVLDELRRARREQRQRQQIEPVVLEHALERPRVAGADVAEVAVRNLEAGHVAFALEAAQRALQRAQAAAAGIEHRRGIVGDPSAPWPRHSRRAGCSMSTCGRPANGVSSRWNR